MQITIQKVWSNDQNRAKGKFVGTDGRTYFIESKYHAMLSEGMTIDPPSAKPSEFKGKTNYFLPEGWAPSIPHQPAPAGNAHIAQAREFVSPAPPAGNGYVPEMEKQGYIMCSVMMKLLADALLQAGKPIDTQDLPLLAQAAVATWRDHLKGKV